MKKIIIDTDPGIDDAIALCYALNHPDLEVLALTTIFGNVATSLATDNALRLCELNNRQNVAVAHGADTPLTISPNPVADFVHGKNGFGNIDLPQPELQRADLSAAELIVELINNNPDEITLVAVGPLTNLAKALQLSPDIAQNVAEVVIMGGAFHHKGNVTVHAEANFWNDPHAAQQVLTAAWPVTVHGLDVTYKISFSREYLAALADNAPQTGKFLQNAAEFYIEFYKEQYGFEGCCPHDLLALTYITKPELFTLENGALDVTSNGEALGKSSIDTTAKTNKFIATDVDSSALLSDYAEILRYAS